MERPGRGPAVSRFQPGPRLFSDRLGAGGFLSHPALHHHPQGALRGPGFEGLGWEEQVGDAGRIGLLLDGYSILIQRQKQGLVITCSVRSSFSISMTILQFPIKNLDVTDTASSLSSPN